MSSPTSVKQLDLTPIAGKTYFNFDREWREEFIYFLLVDRFHDDKNRKPVNTTSNRSSGIHTPDNAFYGGKIKGITQNLDYIAGLGCTAIWVSPIFENNPGAYHGYNINNYLNVDPNFGTKADLVDLVQKAHGYVKDGKPHPLRIILDVVLNHSGDNWEYNGGPKDYCNDQQYEFGYWRRADRPIPVELRNPNFYHRKGNMNGGGYDNYPENQHGDMCGLKDYDNDDDPNGNQLLDIIIKAHCYWIREADVDGFRVDAVKHMGERACAKFSSAVREYAYSLGKKGFFLFGELATPSDPAVDRYIGPNTSSSDNTVFFGLDSILDFRLAEGMYNDANNRQLRDVIKGFAGPGTLYNRYEAQRQRALDHGEIGRYLVTFVDNHDSFWQASGRIANGAPDTQVIASIGYLLCSLGTACIYYGTEQGFSGSGGDNNIREAMFDKNTSSSNVLNANCNIYKEIAKISDVMRTHEELRFGRMYFRQISGDGVNFGLPYTFGIDYTLCFSRILYGSEILVAYNVSSTKSRSDCVVVDAELHDVGSKMNYLYGQNGSTTVQQAPNGTRYVKLDLAPCQFVILK